METELNGFAEFWSVYPRRVAKQAAIRAYRTALKRTTPERILAAAKRYAGERSGQDMQFTAHPASWLNAGRWADYDAAPVLAMPVTSGPTVYVPFDQREAWDDYGRSIGKSYPRDSKGGWWFPSAEPPMREAAE